MEKSLDLTKYLKEDYIPKEIERDVKLQLEANNQTLQTKEQEKESEKSSILQVKANCQILMPEQGVGKAAFAENTTEHVSAKKRQRKLKMHGSALHKKAVNAEQLEASESIWQNEIQKRWETQTKILKNLKQFDDSKKTEQEEAFAQFLESEGITFGIHWTHYLSNIDNLEERRNSEKTIVSSCIQQYIKMEFHLDWRNDETFVKESARMDEISAKTKALKFLLDKHQDIVNSLSEEDRAALDTKLNMGIKIAEYYKVQKEIIENPYYRTHYNSEISRNYNERDTQEQKDLAILMRKAEYLKDTEKVSPLFLGTKFNMDDLKELLSDPAMAQKHNIGWPKLFEETKNKEESVIVRGYIENELIKERLAMLTYAEQYKKSEVKSHPEEQYAGVLLSNYLKNHKLEYGMTMVGLLDKNFGFTSIQQVDTLKDVYKKIKQTGQRYYNWQKNIEKVLEMRKKYESQSNNGDAFKSILKTLESMQMECETQLEKIINVEGTEQFEELLEVLGEADIWANPVNKDFIDGELKKNIDKALADRANQYQDYIGIWNQAASTKLSVCVQRGPLFDYLKDIHADIEILLKEGVEVPAFKDVVSKYNEEYTRLEYLKSHLDHESDREFVVDMTLQIHKGQKKCNTLEKNIKNMIEFRSNNQEANRELLEKDIHVEQKSAMAQTDHIEWKRVSEETKIDEVMIRQFIEKEVNKERKKVEDNIDYTDDQYTSFFFSNYFKNRKSEYGATLASVFNEDLLKNVDTLQSLEEQAKEEQDADKRKSIKENLENRMVKFEKDYGFRSKEHMNDCKIIFQKIKLIGKRMYWLKMRVDKSLEMMKKYKNADTNINKAFSQSLENIQMEYETLFKKLIDHEGAELFKEILELIENAGIWMDTTNKNFINTELQRDIEKALADRANQYQDYVGIWNQATATDLSVCVQRSPLFEYLKDIHVNTELVLKKGVDASAFKDMVSKYNEEYTRLEYLKSHLNNQNDRILELDITFQINKSQRVCNDLEKNIKNMIEFRNTSKEDNA